MFDAAGDILTNSCLDQLVVGGSHYQRQSLTVNDGSCWWHRKYAPGDTVLEGLENVPVPDGFDGLVEVRWCGA
jgi:hypothetical protein